MGREIRRVPENWEHPMRDCPHYRLCETAKRNGGKCYVPMHDIDFESAAQEWLSNFEAWSKGTHASLAKHPEWRERYPYYWLWDTPPEPEGHRPVFERADWYQVYETVSEGTPVTPPFATPDELIDYLVGRGTFWDQYDGKGGWKRENAERFVNDLKWLPSAIFTVPEEAGD